MRDHNMCNDQANPAVPGHCRSKDKEIQYGTQARYSPILASAGTFSFLKLLDAVGLTRLELSPNLLHLIVVDWLNSVPGFFW
jgi:hypothetical protein